MVNNMKKVKIAIIGGGASGLFLAQDLKRNMPETEVTIFEASEKLGRKIDASGNGRGNLTNVFVAPDKYNNPQFVKNILERFTAADFLVYAQQLGLQTKIDEEGRVYPLGDNGKIWRTILVEENRQQAVDILLNTPVKTINKTKRNTYIINHQEFDFLVLALGSKAGPNYKFKMQDNTQIFLDLNVKVRQSYPTLSSLGVYENLKIIDGQRVKATVNLFINGNKQFGTKGEVLFRPRALSGIAVFECSSYLTWEYRKQSKISADIVLDLLNEYSLDDLTKELQNRLDLQKEGRFTGILDGFFTPEINYYILTQTDNVTAESIADTIKNLRFSIDLSYVPNNNQVESGGVDLLEVDQLTLSSKNDDHLFFIGEALDIDGYCGGYNLHFAWASAFYVSEILQKRLQNYE